MKKVKKELSSLLVLCMVLSCIPGAVFAEGEYTHSPDCGYVEAVEGHECNHICSDGCLVCTHEHDENCGYAPAVAEQECTHTHDEACGYGDGSSCTHQCGEECEDGCTHEHDENCGFTAPSSCAHEHDGSCGYAPAVPEQECNHGCSEECLVCSHKHDENCGYVEAVEGHPCTCKQEEQNGTSSEAVLALREMLAELPSPDEVAQMDDEQKEELNETLSTIMDAYEALSEEEQAQIADFEEIMAAMAAAISALNAEMTYIVIIPATASADQEGWNALGEGIQICGLQNPESNMNGLKVSAESEHGWKLVMNASNKVSYGLRESENSSSNVTDFWFAKSDIVTEEGKTIACGVFIDAEEFEEAEGGNYTDTITWTIKPY